MRPVAFKPFADTSTLKLCSDLRIVAEVSTSLCHETSSAGKHQLAVRSLWALLHEGGVSEWRQSCKKPVYSIFLYILAYLSVNILVCMYIYNIHIWIWFMIVHLKVVERLRSCCSAHLAFERYDEATDVTLRMLCCVPICVPSKDIALGFVRKFTTFV